VENKNLNKRPFNSESEARAELERILTTQHKPWSKNDVKPCRYYHDKELDKWFLTSNITIVEYPKK